MANAAKLNGNLKPLGYSQYSIDDDGRVTNVRTNMQLKPFIDRRGYENFSLWGDDGERKTMRGHQLLAKLRIPNPNNCVQVDHIDGNKRNNNISNLEWVSNLENAHRAMDKGLWKHTVLKEEHARAICELLENGHYTQTQIAKDLRIPRSVVANVAMRRCWTYLSKDYDF
jgi:hypothetical protein